MAARLLVVDDESTLLELLRRYLERLGYQVETCTTPEDALMKYGSAPERYELVVTDQTLGKMTGEQMLEKMREIQPGVRGLLCSGYPYEPTLPHVGFLQKPFLPKMLAEAVENALRAKA